MVNEWVISDTACVVSDLKSQIVHMAYFFFFLSVRTACSDPKIGTHYFHPLALISVDALAQHFGVQRQCRYT